jgi:hypothetical protein
MGKDKYNQKKAFTINATKQMKIEKDLNDIRQAPTIETIESALNSKLNDLIGC